MAGNKPGKPKSKRVSVRLRHKIEKASSAKQRKERKNGKKSVEWKSRMKKDPGIPNLFPYKDKILAEIEEARIRKQEEVVKRRAEAKALKAQSGEAVDEEIEARMEGVEDDEDDEEFDMDDVDDDSNPMAALLASARARAQEYDEEEDSEDDEESDDDMEGMDVDGVSQALPNKKDGSRKAFDKVFKQVVDQADVVLYVLDARDPEGTRSKEVERMVMAAASGGKRLILILNKIDLIPAPVLKKWLIHL
ncbi:hypothetical protein V490_01369, partial [Pseudogymnoascus sp. VKM F-3557]